MGVNSDEDFLNEFDQLLEEENTNEEDNPNTEENPEELGDKENSIQDESNDADDPEEGEETAFEEEWSLDESSGEAEEAESNVSTDNVDQYKHFYESVMQPFKANGKTIEIKNPDEALQLMKMGANYTKKMQEISQHRKTIATLNANGIVDEDDIAFLIDLKNKDPEAIAKYFKDNELDPFDVDTDKEVVYKPKTKLISDVDINARQALDELKESNAGRETIKSLSEWDEESIKFLWENPEAYGILHEQRESGVFDTILQEIERQTILGVLPPSGSILEKYNIVGNQLFNNGTPQNDNTVRPIDTRVATRSSAQRSQRAKAAGTPRTGKRTSMVLEDLANLDDDAFLKAMKNKL